jgi:hypothetical protein
MNQKFHLSKPFRMTPWFSIMPPLAGGVPRGILLSARFSVALAIVCGLVQMAGAAAYTWNLPIVVK